MPSWFLRVLVISGCFSFRRLVWWFLFWWVVTEFLVDFLVLGCLGWSCLLVDVSVVGFGVLGLMIWGTLAQWGWVGCTLRFCGLVYYSICRFWVLV